MVKWGRGLVARSALATVVMLACGKTGTVGPDDNSGSAGAGAVGGIAGGAGAAGGIADSGGSVAMNPSLVPPTTVTALCKTYPAAWGDFMARCYGGAAADWGSLIDRPCSETARAEETARIALNAAKVAGCFAVLAGGKCVFGPGESGPPCSDLVTGIVPAGQACTPLGYGDECAPDAHCHAMGACAGMCKPRGLEGQNCHGQFVDVICGAGLDCDGPSAACKVPGAEGQPCAGQLCQAGLYCKAEDGKAGICQAVETEGPCQSNSACAPGFRCIQKNVGEGACTRVKPTGASCTVGLRECAGYCSAEGTCRVVAKERERCGSLQDSSGTGAEYIPCGAGLFCDRVSTEATDEICRRQVPLGAAWPKTVASGNPCDVGDAVAFHDTDADVCAACD